MVGQDNTGHRENQRKTGSGRPAGADEFTEEEMMWPFPVAPVRIPGAPKFNPNNFEDALF